MTVSRVLNDKGEISEATRRHVLQVVEELDYRPSRIARGLATDQTFMIGLVVPNITHGFFSEIALGAEEVAWENGYNILLYNTEEDLDREEAALQLLEETRADGVIVCSARLPDDRLLPLLKKHRAVVVFNRRVPSHAAGVVQIDNADGAMQAVGHLLKAGRRVIGHMTGVAAFSYAARMRQVGFACALEQAGLRANPELQVICGMPGDFEGWRDAAYRLLAAHPEIDGLVCHNDLIAIAALRACKDLGIGVPGDIAVVGYDDIFVASLVNPPLTTLHVPMREVGVTIANVLLERMHGRFDPDEIVIKQKLVVRQSAP